MKYLIGLALCVILLDIALELKSERNLTPEAKFMRKVENLKNLLTTAEKGDLVCLSNQTFIIMAPITTNSHTVVLRGADTDEAMNITNLAKLNPRVVMKIRDQQAYNFEAARFIEDIVKTHRPIKTL